MSKLFLLTQDIETGYDTYDSCVVCADTADEARMVTPDCSWERDRYHSWAHTPSQVRVEYIGDATSGVKKNTVILASFNAG